MISSEFSEYITFLCGSIRELAIFIYFTATAVKLMRFFLIGL